MYTFSANTVIESAKVNANFAELQDDIATTPPIGSVIPYAGSAAPDGYLIADGAEISRTTYSDLFAVIGTTYGVGDGSTTFTLPNLKGRIPVGKSATDTEFDTLGETGGAKTHTLTSAEMPSHTHAQNAHGHGANSGIGYGAGGYGAGVGRADANSPAVLWGFSVGNSTATNQNTGGDGAHNNLQPYITLNYLIRY